MGSTSVFEDGIAIGKTNTDYTNFVLVSRDGRPLKSATDALLSVVSTAENDGLAQAPGCDWLSGNWPPYWAYGRQFVWNLDGKAVVERVGTEISFPQDVTASGADFGMRPVTLLPSVSPKKVVISAEQPIFIATIRVTDNSFLQVSRQLESTLLVALMGDVTIDGTINHEDLRTVSEALGSTTPNSRWLDINGDGIVDILDLAIVARYFGQSAER